jgi:hypothetical protein
MREEVDRVETITRNRLPQVGWVDNEVMQRAAIVGCSMPTLLSFVRVLGNGSVVAVRPSVVAGRGEGVGRLPSQMAHYRG